MRKKIRKIIIIAVTIAVSLIAILAAVFTLFLYKAIQAIENPPKASPEEIAAVSPINEAKSALIDSYPEYGENDTWGIYMYICGSNLEAGDVDRLSAFTEYIVREENENRIADKRAGYRELLASFLGDLEESNLELPYPFYYQDRSVPEDVSENAAAEELQGGATANITDILDSPIPDRLSITMQFGGAKAWGMREVNPNRTQRYEYTSDGFRLIGDYPAQNLGSPDTLVSFLEYAENDDKDHKILILWNHGLGPFGYASDDIYSGDALTLAEMREAFESVYEASPDSPPFEIIGFDACLMANLDVADTLYGFARYLIGSEELVPFKGWNYEGWFENIDILTNGPAVGREIIDAFAEQYASYNIAAGAFGFSDEVTLSLIDVNKAHEVSKAYSDLIATALEDAFMDLSVLTAFGRAAASSISFGENLYDTVNLVDLGLFMKGLEEYYPAEAQRVLQALDEAVLYSRATLLGNSATGLSVYFPSTVESLPSLLYFLDYVQNICTSDDIRAFYYYKIAGCLNKELREYAESEGYGDPIVLDTSLLEGLSLQTLDIDGNHFTLKAEGAIPYIQDAMLYLAEYGDEIIYYGEDARIGISDSSLSGTFDGLWISADGEPLSLEVISSGSGWVKYRSPVLRNGEREYLIIYRSEEELTVLGAVDAAAVDQNGNLLSRNTEAVAYKDKIVPIYRTGWLDSPDEYETLGKAVRYDDDTIRYEAVDDGSYLVFIGIRNARGEEYSSPVIYLETERGNVTFIEQAPDISTIAE